MNLKPVRVRRRGSGVQEALHARQHVNSNTFMSESSRSRLQVPDVSFLCFSIRCCAVQEAKRNQTVRDPQNLRLGRGVEAEEEEEKLQLGRHFPVVSTFLAASHLGTSVTGTRHMPKHSLSLPAVNRPVKVQNTNR